MSFRPNVGDFLLSGKASGQLALSFLDADYTYGELGAASASVGAFLEGSGARKGDRVLLIADNSFFWVSAYLGILRAGLVCVPLPPGITHDDLAFIVESTQPVAAFLQSDIYEKHSAQFSHSVVVTHKEVSNPTGGRQPLAFDKVLYSAREDALSVTTGLSDLAALMYTSGSTAKPRGVMVTHGNIIANTESIIQYLGLTENDRIMAVLPFHYCFGTSLLHTHLRIGGSVVVDHRFMYPEVVLQRMKDTECTGFAGVPSHYQILLRRSSLRRMLLPHLRYVQQAGGHLAPAFIRELRDALPAVRIFVMYGQTEATARLSYVPPELLSEKIGSIGKAIPGVTLRVQDEGANEVRPGEQGEIVAEGENVARGYWGDPQETAACFRNGQLYTGDLATVDKDGFIYVVDRAKDFIKCGGKRVSCRQIEEQLLEFEGLLEVAVVGMPDSVRGEAAKAFVVPKQRKDDAFDELFRAFCKERLPFHLVPQEIVKLDGLPKNSAGKTLKQALRNS